MALGPSEDTGRKRESQVTSVAHRAGVIMRGCTEKCTTHVGLARPRDPGLGPRQLYNLRQDLHLTVPQFPSWKLLWSLAYDKCLVSTNCHVHTALSLHTGAKAVGHLDG